MLFASFAESGGGAAVGGPGNMRLVELSVTVSVLTANDSDAYFRQHEKLSSKKN